MCYDQAMQPVCGDSQIDSHALWIADHGPWPDRTDSDQGPDPCNGGVISLAGTVPLLSGITGLGRQLTPFPRPVADAELRRDGAYGLVRHPMSGGALLIVLGWALLSSPVVLLPLGLAAAFLDAKRRREEAWLVEEHPDYRRAVPRQFIPWVWKAV